MNRLYGYRYRQCCGRGNTYGWMARMDGCQWQGEQERRSFQERASERRGQRSMEVFFIEGMNFLGEVRPAQRPRELFSQPLLAFPSAFSSKLDLPSAQIIQQPHVRLDQYRQPPRAYNQIRIDQRQTKMFHDICNLKKIRQLSFNHMHEIREDEANTHSNSRTPRNSNPTMHQHLTTFQPRFINPIANRLQLRF